MKPRPLFAFVLALSSVTVALSCSAILDIPTLTAESASDAAAPDAVFADSASDAGAPDVVFRDTSAEGAPRDSAVEDAAAADATGSTCLAAYREVVLGAQPIAYFPLEEALYPDGGACHNEVPGSGVTCVYGSAVQLGQPGIVGCASAAHMVGPSGAITLSGSPGLDFPGDQSFTIEAWVKPDAVAPYDSGTGIVLAQAWNGQGYKILLDYAACSLDGGPDGGLGGARSHMGIDPDPGTPALFSVYREYLPLSFFHIVLVHRSADGGGDGYDHLYVNGVESGTAECGNGTASSPRPATGQPLVFGADPAPSNFAGRVGEIAIYARALEPGEITSHYQAGLP